MAEQQQKESLKELTGLPFNIGKFVGGQKASLCQSRRPPQHRYLVLAPLFHRFCPQLV